MRAVDTNVLVRLATRDDANQAEVAEAFVESGGAWVSHLVLLEFVSVLCALYEFGRRQIATAIDVLLEQQNLTIQDPEVVDAALSLFRKGGGVDFTDCMILETARKAGHLPLGTFDRDLARLEGAKRLGVDAR